MKVSHVLHQMVLKLYLMKCPERKVSQCIFALCHSLAIGEHNARNGKLEKVNNKGLKTAKLENNVNV